VSRKPKAESKGPRQVGEVNICGVPYAILVADEQTDESLVGAFGYVKTYGQQIVLNSGQGAHKMQQTMMHEILHAIMAESGIHAYLAAEVGQSIGSDKMSEVEETLIRLLSPHLVMALGLGGK
jgi:Zn-dependent peptidase ImmA (M78 family)